MAVCSQTALFFVVTGLAEGILTAMILAAGRMLEHGGTITASLALRIGLAAGLPEAVVFFAAEYAGQNGDLLRMERQLNLTAHGRLAAGRLGRLALQESLAAALISSACSFVGAVVPLLLASLVPGPGFLSIAVAVTCLGLLGYGIGHALGACKACWASVLAGAGLVLALLGSQLKVI
jgi:VIT1/CCC1 family predicted Fe2+/Mn2+ transporter